MARIGVFHYKWNLKPPKKGRKSRKYVTKLIPHHLGVIWGKFRFLVENLDFQPRWPLRPEISCWKPCSAYAEKKNPPFQSGWKKISAILNTIPRDVFFFTPIHNLDLSTDHHWSKNGQKVQNRYDLIILSDIATIFESNNFLSSGFCGILTLA